MEALLTEEEDCIVRVSIVEASAVLIESVYVGPVVAAAEESDIEWAFISLAMALT
jgi:hypothetical protein